MLHPVLDPDAGDEGEYVRVAEYLQKKGLSSEEARALVFDMMLTNFAMPIGDIREVAREHGYDIDDEDSFPSGMTKN